MKRANQHTLIYAMFLSLISGLVVLIIGYVLGWETSTQFSDGFFWAAVILISIGFISFQGYSYHNTNWPPVNRDSADRAKLWASDTFRGRTLMAVFGISGLLLFALSVLISRLF